MSEQKVLGKFTVFYWASFIAIWVMCGPWVHMDPAVHNTKEVAVLAGCPGCGVVLTVVVEGNWQSRNQGGLLKEK